MVGQDLPVQILRPFGPRILHTQIPQEYVNELNNECDDILKDEQKRKDLDESHELVGHVSEELKCDMHKPKLRLFGEFLCELAKCLHKEYMKEKFVNETIDTYKLDVHSSWFVRSFETDYNPTHFHTNGTLSCVAYLKVPKGIGLKNTKNTKENYTTEGYIDFIYGGNAVLTSGNMCVMPVVGDIFIFPTHLFHTVYPFFGDGERRSFSANMSLTREV